MKLMPWKGFIKQWVSFQMGNTLNTGFLEAQSHLLLLCKKIWMICFDRNNPHAFVGEHRKGLCGSLKIMDFLNKKDPEWQLNVTNVSHHEWKLKVPDHMCQQVINFFMKRLI